MYEIDKVVLKEVVDLYVKVWFDVFEELVKFVDEKGYVEVFKS